MVQQDITQPVPTDEQRPDIYMTLVVGLLVISLLCAGGIIGLSGFGKPIPEGLVALASASVGGLVGMLAPRA